ncbi:MAG TPA: flagellar type III secretion system protein FliR [Thermoanaerobacterales bacterium]|uniref:flagellar biosynthetic protein FliR n=1 Tax=Tepidanaerobacter sp. GT38 TaxID=2722793 RepID=UPI0017EF7415|nr:flagellar biosynthetic protein FliR [Tepidanaerobacter sp. GT38]MCG1011727.1 flagellar type III secretion system protein FliR [Tepidanaerobacter sp. GT38]HHY41901.1 flagellar type III secretion system protein FliR [Thermoanaerobacterales bacterium]
MQISLETALLKFLLILFRCLGYMLITPVFGRREIPAQAKIGLAALLSIIVYPFIPDINFSDNLWILAASTLKEFITGITIGYGAFLLFSSLYLAGEIIDMEMGFGIVNVLDVQSNTQVPLMGNYFYILTILLFLTANGHHMLISAIIKSYDLLPLSEAVFQEGLLNALIVSFKDMFLLGVKIALPVVSVIFLTDLALALIARTVPQMNVFMVGLPVKIAVGMISMIMVFPMFFIILDAVYNGTYENILITIKEMLVRP